MSEYCPRCELLARENELMRRMLRSTRDALRMIAARGDGKVVAAEVTPSTLAKMARHELGKRIAMGDESNNERP